MSVKENEVNQNMKVGKNPEFEREQRKVLDLMDRLCETGVVLEEIARMCSVLRLGMESPDFCDHKDAAACMWVMEHMLNYVREEKISPEVFEETAGQM